jgi:hypothetical protein
MVVALVNTTPPLSTVGTFVAMSGEYLRSLVRMTRLSKSPSSTSTSASASA